MTCPLHESSQPVYPGIFSNTKCTCKKDEEELTEEEYQHRVDELEHVWRHDPVALRQRIAELRTRYNRVGW